MNFQPPLSDAVLTHVQGQAEKVNDYYKPTDGAPDDHAAYLAELYGRRCAEAIREGNVTWRDLLHANSAVVIAETNDAKLYNALITVAGVAAAWANELHNRKGVA